MRSNTNPLTHESMLATGGGIVGTSDRSLGPAGATFSFSGDGTICWPEYVATKDCNNNKYAYNNSNYIDLVGSALQPRAHG